VYTLELKITKQSGLIIGFIAVLSLLLPLNSMTPSAFATNTTIMDDASCGAIGGTWNVFSATCLVTSLIATSGDLIVIPTGTTLELSAPITIPSGVTIDNQGTISSDPGAPVINSGTIINELSGTLFTAGDTLSNSGIITIDSGATITNNVSFMNTGSVVINSGGLLDDVGFFTNNVGALVSSVGLFIVDSGNLENDGTYSNNGGNLDNEGLVVTNVGTIDNTAGTITNNGAFTNTGSILNCNGSIVGNTGIIGTGVIISTCTTPTSSTTSVTLSPASIPLSGSSTVTVQVTGSSPTGLVTFSAPSGTFSPSLCAPDATGQCHVSFTPSTTGPVVITANYGGDSSNAASSGSSTLIVGSSLPSSTTAVTLSPASIPLTSSSTIAVKVKGSSPTGLVTFSAPSGTFSPTTCTLDATGQCHVSFTPSTTGPVVITANYGGDSSNAASSGSSTLIVGSSLPSSTTAVTLSPASIPLTSSSTIAVKVKGSSPTGLVTFSAPSGTFSPTTCTLDATGQCHVSFTPSTTGPVVITANYGGDSSNAASSGSSTLKITTSSGKSTSTTVKLLPPSVHLGKTTRVLVQITGSKATGLVTFSAPSGAFGKAACTLHDNKCTVSFTPSTTGPVVITANYGGDSKNTASSGSATLQVVSAPVKTCDDKNGHHDNDGDCPGDTDNKDHDSNGDDHSHDHNGHGDDDHDHK